MGPASPSAGGSLRLIHKPRQRFGYPNRGCPENAQR